MKIALKILLFLTVASAAAMAEPTTNAVRVPEPMNLLMAGAGVLAGLRLLRNRFTA